MDEVDRKKSGETAKNFRESVKESSVADYLQMEEWCHKLGKALRKLPAKEVKSFNDHFTGCMDKLNTPTIREAVQIVRGDLSEDSFRFCCATIISMGQSEYERILADFRWVDRIKFKKVEFFAGAYSQIARHVYRKKTKKWPAIKKIAASSRFKKITPTQRKKLTELAKGYQAGETAFVARKRKLNQDFRQKIAKLKAARLALVDSSEIKKSATEYSHAQACQAAGKMSEAIRHLTSAVALNPVYAEAFKKRGDCKLATGDIDAAISDYSNAIKLDPYYVAAYEMRAEAKIKNNDEQEALYEQARYYRLRQKLNDGQSDDGAALNRLSMDASRVFMQMDLRAYKDQKLPLLYSYTITERTQAEQLMVWAKERLNCSAEINECEIPGCKYWRVFCAVKIQLPSAGDLFDWIYEMINAGREFGCELGDWGFDIDKFEKLKPVIPVVEVDEDFDPENDKIPLPENIEDGFPANHIEYSYQCAYVDAWMRCEDGHLVLAINDIKRAIMWAEGEDDVRARALKDPGLKAIWPEIEKLEVPPPRQNNKTDTARLSFHPELFEQRTKAIEALDEAGLVQMSHYSSVECDHELYGVEVNGIREKKNLLVVGKVLRKLFPEWDCEESGLNPEEGGPGWAYTICRD